MLGLLAAFAHANTRVLAHVQMSGVQHVAQVPRMVAVRLPDRGRHAPGKRCLNKCLSAESMHVSADRLPRDCLVQYSQHGSSALSNTIDAVCIGMLCLQANLTHI